MKSKKDNSKHKIYFHRKLIRDKVVDVLQKKNVLYKIKTLDTDEYKLQLKKKLIEESNEVLRADDNNLLNELSDVVQVVKCIAESEGMSINDIEEKRIQKEKIAGSFNKRIYLIWTDKQKT